MNKFLGNDWRFERVTDNMGNIIFNYFGGSVKTKNHEDTGNEKDIISVSRLHGCRLRKAPNFCQNIIWDV